MTDLVPLSRAARLVGVTRAALQKRVKNGELPTFEGMVRIGDLTRVFPDTSIENSAMLERVSRIRDQAFGKRVRDRMLPDAEVLAARIAELTRHQARVNSQLELYKKLVMGLDRGLSELALANGNQTDKVARLKTWLETELENGLRQAGPTQPILAHDSLLRLVSAHVTLRPSGHEFFVEGDDSLLDAALRAGLPVPYGCGDGSCGRCRARLLSGQVSGRQPANGDDVLLCRCTAVTDLVLEIQEADRPADVPPQHVAAVVRSVESLPDGVTIIQLRSVSPARLRFLSGQAATVRFPDGQRAELPVASCPCDAHTIEFHLDPGATGPGGYLASGLRSGDEVELAGPTGDFVLDVDSDRPLAFIAIDTGFAPVKSMIEHAFALEHTDAITLYWLAGKSPGHYRENLCRAWADALDFFEYRAFGTGDGFEVGLEQCFGAGEIDSLAGSDVYISGPRQQVDATRDFLRERGIPRERLHAQGLAS